MKIRRIVSVFLLAVLMSILCLPPLAYADEPLDIQAKAALLVDGSSGRVLYAKNEHEGSIPRASRRSQRRCSCSRRLSAATCALTKRSRSPPPPSPGRIPTALPPASKEGEQLTVEELLYCMLVVSANEACSILAEAVSGSVDAFVEQMNQRVQELGCVNTHYVNDSGLHDPQHYSSAWDIYLITREAMKYDEFMTIVNSKSYTVPQRTSLRRVSCTRRTRSSPPGACWGITTAARRASRPAPPRTRATALSPPPCAAAAALCRRGTWGRHRDRCRRQPKVSELCRDGPYV